MSTTTATNKENLRSNSARTIKPKAFGASTSIGSTTPSASTSSVASRTNSYRFASPSPSLVAPPSAGNGSAPSLSSISQEVRALKTLVVQQHKEAQKGCPPTAIGRIPDLPTADERKVPGETGSVVTTVQALQSHFNGHFENLLTTLEEQTASQRKQEVEAELKVSELYAERTELQATIVELQRQKEEEGTAQVNHKEAEEALIQDARESRAEVVRLLEEVAALQEVRASAEEKLIKVQAELASSEEEKQNLQEKMNDFAHHSASAEGTDKEGQNILATPTAATAEGGSDLMAENLKLKEEHDSLTQQLNMSEEEAKAFQSQNLQLVKKIEDLALKVTLLESSSTTANATAPSAATPSCPIEEEKEDAQAAAEAWAMVASQEGEIQLLKDKLNLMEGEVTYLRAEASSSINNSMVSPRQRTTPNSSSSNLVFSRRASVSPFPSQQPAQSRDPLSLEECRRQKKQLQQKQMQQFSASNDCESYFAPAGNFSRSASASSIL